MGGKLGSAAPAYSRKGTLRCVVASLIISLASLSCGTVLAYPSPAVPDINSNPNPFSVDSNEQSWVSSISSLGAILGSLVSGLLMDAVGRKLSILIICVPFTIGWAIVTGSVSVAMLYAGRFITGCAKGLVLGMVPVYLSEISPAPIRGLLVGIHGTFQTVGTLYIYLWGYFLSWTWLAVAASAVLVVLSIGLVFVPETPRWLLMKGKSEEAVSAMKWFRGTDNDEEVKSEIQAIQEKVLMDAQVQLTPWIDFLRNSKLLVPLLKSIALFGVQMMCGNNVLRTYTVTIFNLTGTSMDSNLETIIVGLVGVAGNIVSLGMVDRFGRRICLLISSSMVMVSNIGLAVYFYYDDHWPDYAEGSLAWLPLLSLMMNNFFYNIGVGPVTWAICSEMFPTRSRGRASSIAVTFQVTFNFLSSKFFMGLSDYITLFGAYFICAVVSACGFFLDYFAIPETTGKTLEQLTEDVGSTSGGAKEAEKVREGEENSCR